MWVGLEYFLPFKTISKFFISFEQNTLIALHIGLLSHCSVVEVYSINTSTWTTAPSLNHSRGDLVLGVLGDAVFAVGGEFVCAV